MDSNQETIASKIAGSIVVSSKPGQALRIWRQRIGVRQSLLADEMGVSPSVLSDYECGRRSSPGVGFLKKYVFSLVKLDRSRILERRHRLEDTSAIISIGEFGSPQRARELVKMVDGEVLRGETYLDCNIYGYTILDSIRTIYALSGFDFYSIFGATTERVVVFTKVGMGRSPLVAIRVSQLKPRMVVLHGPKVVDHLAIDLAEREGILLVLSNLPHESSFIRVLSHLEGV